MTTRAVTLRALAVVLVSALILTATPAPATVASPTSAETKYGTKVFNRVNDIRANNGRVKLKKNKCLQRFANRKAEALAKSQNTNLPHTNLEAIQNACGVGYAGENLAFGPFTARQMVSRWMNSPGHKANILFRKYRITGVAARKGGGYWWVAQVFGRKG
jgi:uncharacterized protein YkwD